MSGIIFITFIIFLLKMSGLRSAQSGFCTHYSKDIHNFAILEKLSLKIETQICISICFSISHFSSL